MSLLAPTDQDRLRESFAEMTSPVRLLFFTQTLDCETCLQTRQILDELPLLSDRIAIEEANFVLEKEKATEFPDLARRYRVSGVPKTVVNETIEILGALPPDTFIEQALATADIPSPKIKN